MKTSLVFTAYNRSYYLEETVRTWNEARNLRNWNTSFFIEPSDQQDSIVDIALRLNTEVTTVINETLQGVLVNPWNAIDTAFTDGADFVVLAEDDVVVSQDTLEFFEWASIEYETSHKVMMVNAFSQEGDGKDNQVVPAGSFSPLVWGLWRNRWYDTFRDTWDKDYSTGNPDGSEAGWDWNINRILAANQQYVIRPINSRSDHIGEYAGTHMTPELYGTSRGASYTQIRGRQRYREV
jgi:hypothetical protein